MGTWGYKLFDSDFALDVRDSYLSKLTRGSGVNVATKSVISEFEPALADEDDNLEFWLALAVTQWNYGKLNSFVKKKALELLKSNPDLSIWSDLAELRGEELIRIKKVLLSRPPKPSVPKTLEPRIESGDVFRCCVASSKVVLYGRVINDIYAAFYHKNSERKAMNSRYAERLAKNYRDQVALDYSEPVDFQLDDVKRMDVAFIGSCYLGFLDRIFRVIGNIELENKFLQPIFLYSNGDLGANTRFVWDIWNPENKMEKKLTDIPVEVFQSRSYDSQDLIKHWLTY